VGQPTEVWYRSLSARGSPESRDHGRYYDDHEANGAQEPVTGSILVDEQPQPNKANRDGDEDACPAHRHRGAASAVPVKWALAGEADVLASASLVPGQTCRSIA
jgi:hypothetical protein